MERFLTISDVRAMLKVSRATIWRWQDQGLKVVRVGNVVRVREGDLQAFLARHETTGAAVTTSPGDTGIKSASANE